MTAMLTSREDILAEIHRYVAKHKTAPGERDFIAETRIKRSRWIGKYWVRWTDAVLEAGFEPNTMTQKIRDEVILDQLAKFISALGYFPIREEINMQARRTPGFPVWQTISKRYGGMSGTAAALLEFSRETGNEDLASLCQARIAREATKPEPQRDEQRQPTQETFGFVYLKYSLSLRLYRIGKANNPSRRNAGLSLLLPDDLVPKHEIKTDCPYILEEYWHSRFRPKRRQGEWFDLTRSDVETFKGRRAFMFCEFFP